MRNKITQPNIDLSDTSNYPDGRIKDNTGSGNGTAINEYINGDMIEFFYKLIRLSGITMNSLPDNEGNGYQLIEALKSFANKNNYIQDLTDDNGVLSIPVRLNTIIQGESIILKSNIDKGSQTTIKGIEGDDFTKDVTFVGDFKTGEYVRFIDNGSSVTLIRLVDYNNFETVLNEKKLIAVIGGSSGDLISSVGDFTCSKEGTGLYKITHNLNTEDYVVNTSIIQDTSLSNPNIPIISDVLDKTSNSFTVRAKNGSNGSNIDPLAITFIATFY